MKTRNPIAKDLRTPKYRKRIVLSKKVYSRKIKHPKTGNVHRNTTIRN